ncbi:MAG TPA: protein kinase [Vicinamibacterales bacterium]|nr:protein kinase [Vicinamibacterales bacterium]
MIAAGSRIGSFDILAKVGEGGMGEVYRARDAKLHRDVAIKVLPEPFALDRDRALRFEREAQALAALNHPNIAQVYGALDSPPALVMELVEGEDLAQRLARGAIPVAEAIAIAAQIADALDAAHDRGIVHRDLKPSNIKVRPDGTVKVLDFGLAKVMNPVDSAPALANSPTFTSPVMSQAGVILGTAAYMAPEQARGGVADARADIWAFGVVLYEMLTGRPLFTGAHVSDLLASVLRDGPQWDALPSDTPPAVRRLLHRCLRKDPRERLRSAADARLELTDASAEPDPAPARPSKTARRLTFAALATAALALGAAAYFAYAAVRPAGPPLRKWVIPHTFAGEYYFLRENVAAISPGGRFVAYGDGGELRLSDLATLETRTIVRAGVIARIAWSPDGHAFTFVTDHKTLWRAAIGGEPVRICELPPGVVAGLVWRPDRTILVNLAYSPTAGELFRVADGGGQAERYSAVPGDTATVFYSAGLPDGSLTAMRLDPDSGTLEAVHVGADGRLKKLGVPPHTGMTYASSGHLLYATLQTSGVWAVPFDLAAAAVTGAPFRIAAHGGSPSVSADGTLVYGRSTSGAQQLVWMDRAGVVQGTIGQPQDTIAWPELSPDGTRIAVSALEQGTESIWIHEVARAVKSRVTFGPGDVSPTWHPDGQRLVYQGNTWDLYIVSAEGGKPEPIVAGPAAQFTPTWTRGGRLLFGQFASETASDVWIKEGDSARPFLTGRFNETEQAVSPDGRFIAYASDETGTSEVFVRRFPDGGGRQQVSFGGGRFPAWNPRGGELFYMEGATLMAVPIGEQIGTPRPLFPLDVRGAEARIYHPSAGNRFIVVRTVRPAQNGVTVVQNWFAEFAAR